MSRDLTNSLDDRKAILSNNDTIRVIYDNIGFRGVVFENRYRFTKQQVARFYEVDIRTIERIIDSHDEELLENGYELFTGPRLRNLKSAFLEYQKSDQAQTDINVGLLAQDIDNELIGSNARHVGIFTFKAFLNIGMLLTVSERAKEVRSAILNIVIDSLNKKLGGSTKFINQREEDFIPAAIREYNYRKEFTDALDAYIAPNKFKYSQLTDKIYLSIFKEDAKEYRQILSLNARESVRATMYKEVLDLIASYENGFADFLKKKFNERNQFKFSLSDAHTLFVQFETMSHSIYEPYKENARAVMASRDMAFREALHEKLKDYVNSVSLEDIDKFLGEKSKRLEERIEENVEIFKRLKDR